MELWLSRNPHECVKDEASCHLQSGNTDFCNQYGYAFDENIARRIIRSVNTVTELRDSVFRRFDRTVKKIPSKCNAFEAKVMRPTFFLLWHFVPVLLTLTLLFFTNMKGGIPAAYLTTFITTQALTNALLILVERGRCQSSFGVIFNSLAGITVGMLATVSLYLLN